MDEIRIFIASSSELQHERNALKDFINNLSNDLFDYDLHLKPELWELKSRKFEDARKQDAFNECLINSHVAIFMFGKRVGTYTKEEFELATGGGRDHHKPRHVFAYFKNVTMSTGTSSAADLDNLNNLNEVLRLKQFIANELKQVFDTYDSTNELQIKVANELNGIIRPYIGKSKAVHLPEQIKKLVDLYSKIEQGFLLHKKDRIIDKALDDLHLLYHYNYTPHLSADEFYDRCEQLIISTSEKSTIK